MDIAAAATLSIAAHSVIALTLIGVVHFFDVADAPGFQGEPNGQRLEAPAQAMEIELVPAAKESELTADATHPVAPPDVAPRGEKDPRPDQGAKGKGGSKEVSERALNLADRDDSASLDRSVLSRKDRSQLARLKAGASRQAYEDWRASRQPMLVTFFSTGDGPETFERKERAERDPAHGAPSSMHRDSQGMVLGSAVLPEGNGPGARHPIGTDREGGKTNAPGLGTRASRQRLGAESERAHPADYKPLVDRSEPSVFANDQGKPSDTTDAEQEVASRIQSIVHASTAGGKAGRGRGGEEGPGDPGTDGKQGAGSSSSPMGSLGTGAPDPREGARLGYLRALQAKIQPLWADAFPYRAAVEGREGTAIVTFTLDSAGNVVDAHVSRPSGIPEFDENVRKAVLRGGPYGPLPAALLPALTPSLSFIAKNPAVRPANAGESFTER